MSRVKQVSKRKRLTKAAGVPTLGAAGLGLSLAGSASASALPTVDVPPSLNTTPHQRFVLGEEEMADVSLATFYLFDRENGTGGFTQVARGCGCGGCHGCGGGGGCRGCGGGGGCRGFGGGGGCRGCGCRGCGCGGFGCGEGRGPGVCGCPPSLGGPPSFFVHRGPSVAGESRRFFCLLPRVAPRVTSPPRAVP